MIVQPLSTRFAPEVEDALVTRLRSCPDLAFAYLVEVTVPDHSDRPDPTLLAWLVRDAISSLRASLDLVAAAVAASIPGDSYLDVVILNSVPELLEALERTGNPLVVRDRDELERAFAASRGDPPPSPGPAPKKPWYWPF